MLAIIAAFKEEVNEYLKRGDFRVVARHESLRFYQRPTDSSLVLVEGAVGRQRAEEATRQVIERYGPDFIVSAGFAGGVHPDVRLGDLFICDRLIAVEGPAALWRLDTLKERPPMDLSHLERLTDGEHAYQEYARCGCLSVSEFVPSSSMKAWIGTTFGVSIIDMESYWVSKIAVAHDIPHLVVRSVLDTAKETLPAFVGDTVRGEIVRRWVRAVKYMVSRPTEAPSLIRLATQVKVAGKSLSDFLAALDTTQSSTSAVVANSGR